MTILHPIHLIKGRIRDVVIRDRPQDEGDVRHLADKYQEPIKSRNHELSLIWVGLALRKPHTYLRNVFRSIGVDVEFAHHLAGSSLIGDHPNNPRDVFASLVA